MLMSIWDRKVQAVKNAKTMREINMKQSQTCAQFYIEYMNQRSRNDIFRCEIKKYYPPMEYELIPEFTNHSKMLHFIARLTPTA